MARTIPQVVSHAGQPPLRFRRNNAFVPTAAPQEIAHETTVVTAPQKTNNTWQQKLLKCFLTRTNSHCGFVEGTPLTMVRHKKNSSRTISRNLIVHWAERLKEFLRSFVPKIENHGGGLYNTTGWKTYSSRDSPRQAQATRGGVYWGKGGNGQCVDFPESPEQGVSA